MPQFNSNSKLDKWQQKSKAFFDQLRLSDGSSLPERDKIALFINAIKSMKDDDEDHLDTAADKMHPAYIPHKQDRYPQRLWTRELLFALVR
jgi:hypothetical protein